MEKVNSNVDIERNKELIRSSTEIAYHAEIIANTDNPRTLAEGLRAASETIGKLSMALAGATAAVEAMRGVIQRLNETVGNLEEQLVINGDDLP